MRFARISILAVIGLAIMFSATADVTISDIEVTSGREYKVGGVVAEAALYYIDRAYGFGPLPEDPDDKTLAEDIARAVFIMTANDDKASLGDGFLKFTVKTNSGGFRVWVLRDSRGDAAKAGKAPQWLTDAFDSTEIQFTTPGDANMGAFVIYKGKEVLETGSQVVLGGNTDPPAAGQGSSYVPLVTEEQGLSVEPMGKAAVTWG
ncbi:MAG: hypothetical protein O3A46_08740, partial [Candidatus Poribacteria bacterium]|nr:hypothetical protein [Candidatus Poribacteria bacterium]